MLPGAPPNPGASASGAIARVSSYKLLHSFRGFPTDGWEPVTAPLTYLNGSFYGTTSLGGAKNGGIVFALSAAGKETVLYSFPRFRAHGSFPQAGLIAVSGTLYGTASEGGAPKDVTTSEMPSADRRKLPFSLGGAVFEISTSGAQKVLYSFEGPPRDGDLPYAGLIDVDSNFFGTTVRGGSGNCGDNHYVFGCGTAFAVSRTGSERLLHSFSSLRGDGALPEAGLIAFNDLLYGTTSAGGADNQGTVFDLNASGVERVLYSFKGGTDGANPQAGLIALNGLLYGTTVDGGTNGKGTVFEISTSGQERVVYSFGSRASDGRYPYAGLSALNGRLYGDTSGGGTATCKPYSGCGTVFEVTTSGKERVLHNFGSSAHDGTYPESSLTAVNGILYGTTAAGGTGNCKPYRGCGTIFEVTP
jgi:uncharacterized repeat protein (TIGR03803 family)